jgi:ribonuclease P protein component
MLKKTQRLGRKEFADVFKKGKRQPLPLFLVVSDVSLQKSGIAVVVSKKVAKTAVLRNKIRRRVYEAARLAGLTNRKGVRILICRNGIEEKKPMEISSELSRIQ